MRVAPLRSQETATRIFLLYLLESVSFGIACQYSLRTNTRAYTAAPHTFNIASLRKLYCKGAMYCDGEPRIGHTKHENHTFRAMSIYRPRIQEDARS